MAQTASTSSTSSAAAGIIIDLGEHSWRFARAEEAVPHLAKLAGEFTLTRAAYRDARLRLGRALVQLKRQTSYGEWGVVLGRLGMNERTVQATMRLAVKFTDEQGRLDRAKVEEAAKAHRGTGLVGTGLRLTGAGDDGPSVRQLRMLAAEPRALDEEDPVEEGEELGGEAPEGWDPECEEDGDDYDDDDADGDGDDGGDAGEVVRGGETSDRVGGSGGAHVAAGAGHHCADEDDRGGDGQLTARSLSSGLEPGRRLSPSPNREQQGDAAGQPTALQLRLDDVYAEASQRRAELVEVLGRAVAMIGAGRLGEEATGQVFEAMELARARIGGLVGVSA